VDAKVRDFRPPADCHEGVVCGSLARRERWLRALLDASPAAMIVGDARGRVVVVNARAHVLFGYTEQEFVGLKVEALLPERLRESHARHRAAWLAQSAPPTEVRELLALRKDGSELAVEIHLSAMPGAEERLVVVAVLDVSRRHAVETERETLLQVLEQSTDFVGLADLDGNLRYLNGTARRLVGHDACDYRGRRIEEYVAPRSRPYYDQSFLPAVRARGVAHAEMWLRNLRTGEEIEVHRSIFLVRDPASGAPVGYGSISRDMRDLRRARHELEAERRRLRLALDAGGMGVWEWDYDANRSLWSDREFELAGVEPVRDGPVDTAEFFARVHPDDRASFEAAIARAIASGEEFAHEFRIRHPTRGVRWLAGRARLVPAEDGGVRMLGLNWDVTEHREREAALRAANERAGTNFELLNRAERAARVGAFVDRLDRADGLVWSDTLFELLGVPNDGTHDRARALEMFPAAVRAVLKDAIAKVEDDCNPVEIEVPLVPAPGRAEWVRVYFVPHLEGGRCVQISGAVQDISDRKRLELEVVAAADAERERIGADLHDDLGQILTGLSLQMHALVRQLGGEGALAEQARSLEATLQRAREACRRLSRAYVAPVSTESFEAMLLQLAADVPDEIRCIVRATHPLPTKTPMNVAQELFRIAQEAVSNSIRHSGCREITLDLIVGDERIELVAQDDGVGPRPGGRAGGVGLTTMRSRAARIGGLLAIEPRDGGGTVVRVTVARND
jgi:PAS domain S-box-containing protein